MTLDEAVSYTKKSSKFDKDLNIPVASVTESGWMTFNKCAVEEYDLNDKYYTVVTEGSRLCFEITTNPSKDSRKVTVRSEGRAYFNMCTYFKTNEIEFKETTYFRVMSLGLDFFFIDLALSVNEKTVFIETEEEPVIEQVKPVVKEEENLGGFELFTKLPRRRTTANEASTISFSKEGRFFLSPSVVKKYELTVNPYVKLFYDAKNKRIGFKFTMNGLDLGARKMIPQKRGEYFSMVINSKSFFRKYELTVTETKTYLAEFDEEIEMVFIQL